MGRWIFFILILMYVAHTFFLYQTHSFILSSCEWLFEFREKTCNKNQSTFFAIHTNWFSKNLMKWKYSFNNEQFECLFSKQIWLEFQFQKHSAENKLKKGTRLASDSRFDLADSTAKYRRHFLDSNLALTDGGRMHCQRMFPAIIQYNTQFCHLFNVMVN